jgi:aminoglycoside phosphotransferase (APT) family kinase protein
METPLAAGRPGLRPVIAGSAASTSQRLPALADLAQHYAAVTGRNLSRLAFYLALGYFKIAVIAVGIHARFLQGNTRGAGFGTVGQAVAPISARGLRALAGGL